MATGGNNTLVREVVGIFFDPQPLKNAIDELLASNFTHGELGLLASEQVIERSLGDLYARTNNNHDASQAPAIAFIGRESIGETTRSVGGGLFFVGTTGVMGGVVASSAILGGALLAAASGVLAVGVLGAVAATVIHRSDAEFLQQHVDEGHILLFVRIVDASREQLAMDILARHSGSEIKVYEVPGIGADSNKVH
jgi:outer membrane lipoprotein SlyB